MVTFKGMVVGLYLVKSNKNIKLASKTCFATKVVTNTVLAIPNQSHFFRDFWQQFRSKNFTKLLFVGQNKKFSDSFLIKKLDEVFPTKNSRPITR